MSQARRLRRLWWLWALGCVLSTPVARAQQPATEEAIRFQYGAPAECPDLATFTARVRARTARGRVAAADELARTFAVAIAAEARGFSGSVEFLDDTGSSVSRRVHGEACDEVVSSLALITALALDASLRPEPEQPATSKPAPVVAPPAPPVPALRPVSVARPGWEADGARGPSARVGVSGGYSVPLDAFSLGLLGQLDWPRTSSLISGLALRLRGHYADADRDVDTGRHANLRLLGLEVSACPKGVRVDPFTLYLCGAFDLGSLRARGVKSPALPFPGSSTILWVAVGLELRLAWQPEAPFWLECSGQLGTPLVEHTFRFKAPTAEAFKAEPGLSAGAGIVSGVRFW